MFVIRDWALGISPVTSYSGVKAYSFQLEGVQSDVHSILYLYWWALGVCPGVSVGFQRILPVWWVGCCEVHPCWEVASDP